MKNSISFGLQAGAYGCSIHSSSTSRLTSNSEVISSPVGSVPVNALVVIDGPTPQLSTIWKQSSRARATLPATGAEGPQLATSCVTGRELLRCHKNVTRGVVNRSKVRVKRE